MSIGGVLYVCVLFSRFDRIWLSVVVGSWKLGLVFSCVWIVGVFGVIV